MNIVLRLKFLKNECMQDLTIWQKDFVREMSDGVEGLGSNPSDEILQEYLTPTQISKINEIYRSQTGGSK